MLFTAGAQRQGNSQREFIAHKSQDFANSFILTCDGKRFGMLQRGRFYSDDAELCIAINRVVNPKQSLKANLAQVRHAYEAHAASQRVVEPEILVPVVAQPMQQERAVTAVALKMASVLIAVIEQIGKTTISKARKSKLLAAPVQMKEVNPQIGASLH